MALAANLPTLYKGAGPGTHWHQTDPRTSGGFSTAPMPAGVNAAVRHITAYSFPSAFLSCSTSFAIAREYGLVGPAGFATAAAPGYVYEIDFQAIAQHPAIEDPIALLASGNGQVAHYHNGSGTLIAEVAQGLPFTQAHQAGGGMLTPAVNPSYRALVFAIRDGEILVAGHLLAGAIVRRHDVF